MNYPVLTFSACMAALAAILLVAGCTSPSYGGDTNVPRMTTPFPPGNAVSTTCGFTTCHGLDLACGTHAPEACTMLYQLGDRCRQYAQCTSGSDGSCSLVTSPQFASCRACVEKCGKSAGSDPQQMFACEEKC
jgi:hypothetical protein